MATTDMRRLAVAPPGLEAIVAPPFPVQGSPTDEGAPRLSGSATGHAHEECGSRERLWLDRERRSPASAALHPYCVRCGTVKDLTLPRARPFGFYLAGLGRLREVLERSLIHPKLAQVQGRLIAQRMAASGEFDDPYGTPGRRQLEAYAEAVRAVRPDLDEELVLRMLPALRAKRIHTALKAMQGDANAAHPRN